MSLEEALRKSDGSGRESARNAIRTIAATIGGAVFILFGLDQLGVNIAVWEQSQELVMSRVGLTGATVTAVTILLAYTGGFREMLQKYKNTGKLGGAGVLGVLAGVSPAIASILAPSIPIPLWLVMAGVLLSLGSAVFYGQQQELHEQST